MKKPEKKRLDERFKWTFQYNNSKRYNQAISDYEAYLPGVEEMQELVWDVIQCALDKANIRAGKRENLEQIFLDCEIPKNSAQAIAKRIGTENKP